VLLFVRGHVSSRRGSAIAVIACGLPIVGYRGAETGFPITNAGVLLVPQGNQEALAEALGRSLAEDGLRQQLCERSLAAQREHFSWGVIAGRLVEALANG
jgi:glycosyltransferase involved in cell wall biosynthesis